MMSNIYGVVALDAPLDKGYGDFVQHTNPLKEGLLRLSISGAQTLCNSFRGVQITIGETPSLKLKADNSLIGLISVREPELVNLLIQLNYRESRESANSLIIAKTCIAGTSPNVLMKSDFVSFPSRDDTHKTQKEKGSVRSTALWDDCTFNHEENHYSTDLGDTRNPYLAYSINQQVSQPSFRGEHILTTIGGWDLRLYGTLSPAQTLHTEIIGTQSLQVTKRYSQNNPEIIGAVHSANDISSAQLSGSGLAFLRWRRLISPLAAVTKKPAVLSPSSLSDSIFSITSCGIRTVVICDFAFFAPVTITDTPWDWCMSVYAKKITKKGLWCISLEYSLCCEGEIHLNNCEARKCANTNRASIHNVTGANTMAFTHSTQTRPKFTYLFLGTPSDLPTCTPTVLRAEADTEAEARAKFIDWDLTFAAQIRTAAPSRLQLFSTDDGFMWIYEQRQEASHA